MPLGRPVFNEALAVALDKSGPITTSFSQRLDWIIGEMHADGTLTGLDEEWLGLDLTKAL